MDKEYYYIIKRIPWEYNELPEYYLKACEFTRNFKSIRVFSSIDQACDVIQFIRTQDPNSENYTFEIVRM